MGLWYGRPGLDVDKYAEVRRLILENHYKELSAEELDEAALRGMFKPLKDPYSIYLSREESAAANESLEGEFGGVGIRVEPEPTGYMKVVSAIENTPAHKAGILPGDRIVAVDGKSIEGWPTDRVIASIRGPVDTEVTLTLQRGEVRLDARLRRAVIEINPVFAKMEDPERGIGYLRVKEFNEKVVRFFDEGADRLLSAGMKGLVLDLRNNPGGKLDKCKEIADRFLSGGIIVTCEGRTYPKEELRASPGHKLESLPVVILVNEGSASASEILAGALQDHGRAKLVGEPTYGKGLVQRQYPLPDGTVVRVTVAVYRTPRGRWIDRESGKRIEPDVAVALTAEEFRGVMDGWSREENGAGGEPAGDRQKEAAIRLLREALEKK